MLGHLWRVLEEEHLGWSNQREKPQAASSASFQTVILMMFWLLSWGPPAMPTSMFREQPTHAQALSKLPSERSPCPCISPVNHFSFHMFWCMCFCIFENFSSLCFWLSETDLTGTKPKLDDATKPHATNPDDYQLRYLCGDLPSLVGLLVFPVAMIH